LHRIIRGYAGDIWLNLYRVALFTGRGRRGGQEAEQEMGIAWACIT